MKNSNKKKIIMIICVVVAVLIVILIVYLSISNKAEDTPYIVDAETITNVDTSLPAVYTFFENKNEGIVLCVGEPAMGTFALQAYKTEDGGETWSLQTNEGGEKFISVRFAAEYLFISLDTGFIFDPATGDRYAKLLMTTDGGRTFETLDFIEDVVAKEVYDYYELPSYDKGVLTVNISQGSDGDTNGGKTVLQYLSKDMGGSWEFEKEFER